MRDCEKIATKGAIKAIKTDHSSGEKLTALKVWSVTSATVPKQRQPREDSQAIYRGVADSVLFKLGLRNLMKTDSRRRR